MVQKIVIVLKNTKIVACSYACYYLINLLHIVNKITPLGVISNVHCRVLTVLGPPLDSSGSPGEWLLKCFVGVIHSGKISAMIISFMYLMGEYFELQRFCLFSSGKIHVCFHL